MTWNTIDIVNKAGGTPIQCKIGHAFIKERMRAENAIYGGEMSAHHYFRDFAYCDSGMIPWLLIAELLSTKRKPLSKLVDDRINAYPCSGEINCKVEDTQVAIEKVLSHFEGLDPQVDNTDGISPELPDWRFSLHASNTEPLLRLNVEARGNPQTVEQHVTEIEKLITGTDRC